MQCIHANRGRGIQQLDLAHEGVTSGILMVAILSLHEHLELCACGPEPCRGCLQSMTPSHYGQRYVRPCACATVVPAVATAPRRMDIHCRSSEQEHDPPTSPRGSVSTAHQQQIENI